MLSKWYDRLSSRLLPYEMFDVEYSEAEAARARRMENIYHVGQERAWHGKEMLQELVEKHGRPELSSEIKQALGRVLSVLMWGELASWKISAQLADAIEPLEGKLAATSQAHDEARHFYVMHDYLALLGHEQTTLGYGSRRLVGLTLTTKSLAKKLLGMQLSIEVTALTLFQELRELDLDPVLTELLLYFERDEARHVGLGIQLLPPIIGELSPLEFASFVGFAIDLNLSQLIGLKVLEPDLVKLGIDPRLVIAVATDKHRQVHRLIQKEFPDWETDTIIERVGMGLNELFFPSEGKEASVPMLKRLIHFYQVARKLRPSLHDVQQGKHRKRRSVAEQSTPSADLISFV